MENSKIAQQVTREALLDILSDAEVAKVSSAEAMSALVVGDEYIDLEQLDAGVMSASAESHPSMGSVIPRSAVMANTWHKLTARLSG